MEDVRGQRGLSPSQPCARIWVRVRIAATGPEACVGSARPPAEARVGSAWH